MLEIKQLIPLDFCLSCRCCCRYAARDTVWAPVFLFDEIVELTEKNIVPSCLFTPLETLAMFYTYVLRSRKDRKLYTGSTNNLRKRFLEHNEKKVLSTQGRGPFDLIYYEACINQHDALARERYLKSGMGKRYIKTRTKRFLSLTGFTHPNNHKKRAAGIDLIEEGEGFVCPCLDSSRNRCKIYPFRPLDCQLYPFLLARKGDVLYLALDENCPFIQNAQNSAAIKQYIQELKTFLTSPEFLKTAKKNPEIFQQYPPEVRFLTPLSDL